MASSAWKQVIANSVEEFEMTVKDTVTFYMQSFLDLVELLPPADRLAAYEEVNWDELARQDPETWAKWSQDFLELRNRKVKNGRVLPEGEPRSPTYDAYAST